MRSIRFRRFPFRLLGTACLLSIAPVLFAQQPPSPAKSAKVTSSTPPNPEQGPHLSGDQVTVPAMVVKGWVFIQGSISGRPGDLMFDTGTAMPWLINTHAVTPPNGHVIDRGRFTSGQTYDIVQFPRVDRLDLAGGLHFNNLAYSLGYDGRFMEKGVNPRYIGSLGVGFYEGYVFKLDYAAPSLTFYRNDASDTGEAHALQGETLLQTLPFDKPWQTPATLAGTPALVGLDSGAHSFLALNARQRAALEEAGRFAKQAPTTTRSPVWSSTASSFAPRGQISICGHRPTPIRRS